MVKHKKKCVATCAKRSTLIYKRNETSLPRINEQPAHFLRQTSLGCCPTVRFPVDLLMIKQGLLTYEISFTEILVFYLLSQ